MVFLALIWDYKPLNIYLIYCTELCLDRLRTAIPTYSEQLHDVCSAAYLSICPGLTHAHCQMDMTLLPAIECCQGELQIVTSLQFLY